ncbi:transmembrane repetitive protein [Xanthomonas arboricola pv. arracaciae]|uniref:transmembrane repetitive protein n=1 Tax=Xanthomonas arboricola TaxID=56448 RepID=UPI000CEE599A|nr:transmembrane repetitive protein [Xanthomonas arboricola]PPT93275.1 transmembrane repetitive protein [Xanthomonas arboricola pv. arracaciae]
MTTAADLLQALRARMPGKLILDRRTGLPYGWATWMSSRIGPAAAFNDDQVMGVLLARPASPVGAGMALPLSRFQAFRSLWWQHWEPRPKDQRPQHWLALLGSLLIHLGFIALLIWVVTVRWAPDDTKTGDESRVRMTFIGDGAVEQGGGQGQPADAAQAASGDAASAPQSSASAATAATGKPNGSRAAPPEPTPVESVDPPSSAAQAQDIAPEPVAAAASEPVAPEVPRVTVPVPPVTIESPLQVTETPVATNDFVVPPPPTITVAPRPVAPAAPQIEVRQRDIQTVTEQPQLRELQRPAATVAMRTANAPTVREREIVVPDRPQVVAPSVRSREITPTVRMPDVAIRTAELPSVPDLAPQPAPAAPAQPTPATSAPTSSTSVAAATQPSAASTQPNQAQANSARSAQPSATAAASSAARPATNNAGPAPVDRSGGWDVAANADDWSKSDRRRAGETTGANGARNGTFNADGSVHVAAGTGDAGNGAGDRGPPGSETDTWTRDQIAQGGTWLKRPPYGYTPTSLDKYWMPNQSLLQEWVRRGLKKIEIPIPGTTTKISCVVSLLQFGGGCGLSDPNLNDQPATARPPPDVPFKRELQEDNGAVR